ncbi:DEKNAAC102620 [Brettanomyces naardenensis]|uniref:DEKNAAC102620 n=1 Tax=Brettanomyces naardenensis TaxID=13370 RepID=A0A448YLS4_BRENA|nr:DEKNAAC102620 [Brettanomyces naardenensis]
MSEKEGEKAREEGGRDGGEEGSIERDEGRVIEPIGVDAGISRGAGEGARVDTREDARHTEERETARGEYRREYGGDQRDYRGRREDYRGPRSDTRDHRDDFRDNYRRYQAEEPALPVDENDYDRSIKDDFVYEVSSEPEFGQTRALFIGNLRPPFENSDLRKLLSEEAAKVGSTIERAWLNERRSHCLVIVSEIGGATGIQRALNGKVFPESAEGAEGATEDSVASVEPSASAAELPQPTDLAAEPSQPNASAVEPSQTAVSVSLESADPAAGPAQSTISAEPAQSTVSAEPSTPAAEGSNLPLYIDFIPVKATQLWIDQESRGPKDAVWKVSYVKVPSREGSDFLIATHRMLNYPNRSYGYKSSRGRYGRRGGGYRGRGRYRGGYREREYRGDYYRDYYQGSGYRPYGSRDREYGGYGRSSRDYGNSDVYRNDRSSADRQEMPRETRSPEWSD